ncbi:hypothetical protein ACSQ76_12440 [Roseovarius sp. B08]|uniref:hypothetical protein n=1 Tax=Roseovarius sp. B08 TaxID=3449223 RepID=UPI003EDC0829
MGTKPIPIAAAKRIAKEYGYDQVVIVARKVDPDGNEHVTTFGVDSAHCQVAARIGTALKHHLMGWPSELFQTDLLVHGVGRDAFSDQTINLYCDGAVSDEQLRAVHNFLKPRI